MSKEQSVLTAVSVKKDFWQGNKLVSVLKGISIEFTQGLTYAITGVSGSGKSTLMHILGGLDSSTSGTVLFNGHDIFYLFNKEEFRNKNIGFVFQFHYLIKELTVRENIMLLGLIRGETKKNCIIRADMLIEKIGLQHRADFYPGQLSGGEQQRVSIARAIFNKPAFLLADEPTGNLDAQNVQQVVELLLEARRDWGMGIIVCTHDEQVYKRMDIVHTIHDGLFTSLSSQT
ncbi:MAG: ABC transporter ATP-binding protein [bacterium]